MVCQMTLYAANSVRQLRMPIRFGLVEGFTARDLNALNLLVKSPADRNYQSANRRPKNRLINTAPRMVSIAKSQ